MTTINFPRFSQVVRNTWILCPFSISTVLSKQPLGLTLYMRWGEVEEGKKKKGIMEELKE